jgi:hypothetical protein
MPRPGPTTIQKTLKVTPFILNPILLFRFCQRASHVKMIAEPIQVPDLKSEFLPPIDRNEPIMTHFTQKLGGY